MMSSGPTSAPVETRVKTIWPADKVPGARQGLTEAEAALLAQLQRRPYALNKRERDQLVKLERKAR
jgi:hypothetical protein